MKIKFLIPFFLVVVVPINSKSQNGTTFDLYKYRKGELIMSKEEFLKIDSITYNNQKITGYTIVVAPSCGKPLQYLISQSSKIKPQAKEWIKERDSCIVSFDEIKVWDTSGYTRMIPPLVFSVK